MEVLLEKRQLDSTELTLNNVLAMALNSRSSKCVEFVLDITAAKKVSARVCMRMPVCACACV